MAVKGATPIVVNVVVDRGGGRGAKGTRKYMRREGGQSLAGAAESRVGEVKEGEGIAWRKSWR